MSSSLAQAAVDVSAFEGIVSHLESDVFRPGQEDVKRVARGMDRALSFVHGQHEEQVSNGRCFDGIREGKTFVFHITPGTLALEVSDVNKIEKQLSVAYDKHLSDVDNIISGVLATDDNAEDSSKWWHVYCGENGTLTDLATLEQFEKDGVDHLFDDRFVVAGFLEDEIVTIFDRETGEMIGAPSSVRQEIKHWSKKSRMRMVRHVAELDYSNWGSATDVLAMVTLTLPGKWEEVAPTGKVFKKLFKRFEARCRRALGSFKTLWKLEFQERGAAHVHMLMKIPATVGAVTFEQWLSLSWAEIVGASKEVDGLDKDGNDSSEYLRHLAAGTGVDYSGSSYSDPRRIALYFLGHSSKTTDGKEYQHNVPELWQAPGAGPGRFWGCPGFKKALVSLEITINDFYRLARELRKLKRSRDWVTGLKRMRGYAARNNKEPISAVDVRWRKDKTESLGASGKLRGGWVLLNDALQVTMQLTQWMRMQKQP